MKTITTDAVVIGGGIIGSSTAYYLSQAGLNVTLVEKNGIGCGTSGSCDGFMFLQTKKPGLSLEIALESARMYSSLSKQIKYDVHYRQNGGLILIETQEQLEIMEKITEKQKALGLDVDIIDIDETRKREPRVSKKLLGAVYSPMDGHVNPISVTMGYMEAAKRQGAVIYQQTPVLDLDIQNDTATVKTQNFNISAPYVVNAAGVWAPAIGDMAGLTIPIIPRRGQILVTEPLPPMFNHVMLCARYIAIKHNPDLVNNSDDPGLSLGVGFGVEQTDNGNLLISNSRDFAGFDTQNTHKVLKEIAKYALRFIPELKDLDIIRTYAGLRPYTPDGLPFIGPVKALPSMIMAAGHEGDGIAQAPVTGKMVADYISKGSCNFPLDAFSLERIDDEWSHD
ncbi:MAG: FAD-binding oxidoreductase [Desulfobacterales bacterium]|nr:FAD-binding oxidoreductase [Desulfobacterales bacterium]